MDRVENGELMRRYIHFTTSLVCARYVKFGSFGDGKMGLSMKDSLWKIFVRLKHTVYVNPPNRKRGYKEQFN